MIKYNLMCAKQHFFEIKFNNSKNYKEEMQKKTIQCPICNSKNVYLSKKNIDDVDKIKKIMEEFKNTILKNYSFADKQIVSELLKINKHNKSKRKPKNIFGFITDSKDIDKIIESKIDCIVLPISFVDNKKNS